MALTKAFFILVFLVLGLIVSPVCAYTEQFHLDYGPTNFFDNGYYTLRSGILVKNFTAFNSVTKIEFKSLGRFNGFAGSCNDCTIDVYLKVGGVLKGNGTVTWDLWDTGTTYTVPGTATIIFDDFTYVNNAAGVIELIPKGGEPNLYGHGVKGQYPVLGFPRSTGNYEAMPLVDGAGTCEYEIWVYSGSPVVAPTANFTNLAYPKTCYYPGEYVDLDPDASTGTEPFTYSWELYGGTDYTDIQNSTEQYPLFELPDVGLYSVELTVTGPGGSDAAVKYDWLEVSLGGNCTLLNQNVTPIDTIALVPTGIENIINRTLIRNMTSNTFIGNLSGGWFNASDYFADGVNATFGDIIGIFTTPLDWLALAVGTVFTDIASLTEPFIDTSNFFLQMVSRSLAALPPVIVNLVTLGLLVDVVRLVLVGRGGME